MNRRFLSSSGGDAVDQLESFEHVPRIVRDLADVLNGVPVFAGSQPAATSLACVDAGNSWARVAESRPWLTGEHLEPAKQWGQLHRSAQSAADSSSLERGSRWVCSDAHCEVSHAAIQSVGHALTSASNAQPSRSASGSR